MESRSEVRPVLRRAAVKAGEILLFVVLLLAGLWIVLALVKVSGWWEWLVESGPDGPVAAVTLPVLAVLLIAVTFIHDRIMRKVGVRPPEAVAVTVRKSLREMAGQAGQGLLFIALFAAFFIVWAVLASVTGIRAAMYQNMPLSVVVMVIGFVLSCGGAWICHAWIMRKLRARGRPPERKEGAPP